MLMGKISELKTLVTIQLIHKYYFITCTIKLQDYKWNKKAFFFQLLWNYKGNKVKWDFTINNYYTGEDYLKKDLDEANDEQWNILFDLDLGKIRMDLKKWEPLVVYM